MKTIDNAFEFAISMYIVLYDQKKIAQPVIGFQYTFKNVMKLLSCNLWQLLPNRITTQHTITTSKYDLHTYIIPGISVEW